MGEPETELREQFRTAFEGAEYPVDGQMDLVPALPDGPNTTFEAGETRLTAMEMAANLGEHQDFPYEDVDSLVSDIIEGLRIEGMLPE